MPDPDRNRTKTVFLGERSVGFFFDWETKAVEVIFQLRLDTGMHPTTRGRRVEGRV